MRTQPYDGEYACLTNEKGAHVAMAQEKPVIVIRNVAPYTLEVKLCRRQKSEQTALTMHPVLTMFRTYIQPQRDCSGPTGYRGGFAFFAALEMILVF